MDWPTERLHELRINSQRPDNGDLHLVRIDVVVTADELRLLAENEEACRAIGTTIAQSLPFVAMRA